MEESGTPRISFPRFLLKILAGMAGGVVGTLVLLLIFVIASPILSPVFNPEGEQILSPIFVFVLMMMIFLSSTVGNLLSIFLLSLTEHEKYRRTYTAIYQVFIVSIIILILAIPVYFITSTIGFGVTVYAVALHIIISAQVSALILEIVSNYKYPLVGLYGVTFSIFISATVMMGLTKVTESPTILLFVALPIVWGSIAFTESIVTMIYGWIVEIYDKDFLSTQTLYGKDYGKEVESEEPKVPKAEDEAGADFLRHN